MTMTKTAAPPRKRKKTTAAFPHGYQRGTMLPRARLSKPAAPAGTSFLLGLAVIIVVCIGIVRVRTTTEVLELGAEITRLTDRQAELLERKRRLTAELAYLRHPDQIGPIARERLGMVPIAPELVQRIRVEEVRP